MEENLFELLIKTREKKELAAIKGVNEKTAKFGLSLTEEGAKELIVCRNESLKKYQRVEFESGILDKLIYTFCDSNYIHQDIYLETLERLQDIFYEFKNKANDKLSDDELLEFMRAQFDGVCFGDLEYLEGTCLDRFAQAIRSGYTGYRRADAAKEYEQFDEEPRWDKDVYLQVVKELFWG